MAELENVADGSGAAAIIDAVERLHQVQPVKVLRPDELSGAALAVPRGMRLESVKKFLDEYLEAPPRRRGTAQLTTLEAFIAHVNRFRSSASAVFAIDEPGAPKLVSVLDYHPEGPDVSVTAWGEHRGEYAFPLSDEWQIWTRPHSFTQQSFAEFLEDRIGDVMEPSAAPESVREFAAKLGITLAGQAALLALSKGLSVHVDQKVANAVSLSSGEGQVFFEETHRDSQGAPVKVPSGFAVAIPVFRGGALYPLPVRLRYRVKQGAVSWHLAVHRAELVFRHAFDEACERVGKETDLPVFYGQPEQ